MMYNNYCFVVLQYYFKETTVVGSKMTKGKEDLAMTILELFLDVAQTSGCFYCLSRTTAEVDLRDHKVDS